MIKSLRGGSDAVPFFGSKLLNLCAAKSASSRPKAARHSFARGEKSRKEKAGLLDGIVPGATRGERVFIHSPARSSSATTKAMSERNVEIRTRVAIAAAGVLVMKHTVEPCHCCGRKPTKRTGLGIGTSDLLCIVPPFGRACFIEMKKPGYVPSDVTHEQKCFVAIVRRHGGVAGVASSVEEAMALVNEARRP